MATLVIVCSTLIFATSYAQSIAVEFTIDEEQPAGDKIGNIPVKSNLAAQLNLSTDAFSSLEYSFLTDNPYAKLLSINRQTGELFSAARIDRESLPSAACINANQCKLEFDVAVNVISTGDFYIITVTVWVNDINDNAPTFPQPVITKNISESASVGYIIPIPAAIDHDTGKNNGIIDYEIYPLNGTFRLNTTKKLDGSFQVKLILQEPLDRETNSKMVLQVFAKDGGSKQNIGTLQVNINVLDANDNPPIFTLPVYNLNISEDTIPGTSILRVQATDKDSGINGQIEYHFSQLQSQTLNDLFSVDTATGDISLRQKLVYESNKIYSLVVEARDKGAVPQVAQVEVHIQVEDAGNNPPVIKINLLSGSGDGQTVSISELSKVNAFVAHVNVEDSDKGNNGNVTCSTSSSSFGIESLSSKGYKVVIKKELDREMAGRHDVMVTCHDYGTPPLSSSASFIVNVVDENDNKPEFEKGLYQTMIEENNEKGVTVDKVSASDKDIGNNAQIKYLLHSDAGSYFNINSNTGVITASSSFNREVRSEYLFRVLAVDNGDPPKTGTTTVMVTVTDLNDNKPKFNQSIFMFGVQEEKESDAYVGRLVASDLDEGQNAQLQYSMSSEDIGSVPFVVFPNGTIKTSQILDREFQSQYNFKVFVKDFGIPSLNSSAYVTVYVTDTNDNVPEILFPNKMNNTVSSQVTSLPITKIVAVDKDSDKNKELTYFIQKGNENGMFNLLEKSGELFLNRNYHFATDQSVSLFICVRDSGVPAKTQCTQLNVEVTIKNATTLSLKPESDNKFIYISIGVIIFTIIISVGILIIIIIIRKKDKGRQKAKSTPGPLGVPMQNGYTVPSSSSLPDSTTEEDYMERKKVTFSPSMEDTYKANNQNLYDKPPSYNSLKSDSHIEAMNALKLQQILLKTENKVSQSGRPCDNHSDTSGETIQSDSGRGGSEDDAPSTAQTADDSRSFEFTYNNQSLSPISFMSTLPKKGNKPPRPPPCKVPPSSDKRHSAVQYDSAHNISYSSQNSYSNPHYSSQPDSLFLVPQTNHTFSNSQNQSHLGMWDYVNKNKLYPNLTKDYFNLGAGSMSTIKSRDEDDDAATTTSGSYTINPEELDGEIYRPNDFVV